MKRCGDVSTIALIGAAATDQKVKMRWGCEENCMDSDHEDTGSRSHMQVNILGLTASDANWCHSANLVKLKDTSSEQ
jgi:hypothetical protein